MSKRKSDAEYRKTRAYRFFQWYKGNREYYLGEMEVKRQEPFVEPEATIEERMHDREQLHEKIYDAEQNKELIIFQWTYKIAALLLCVVIIGLLLVTVSHLPPTGSASNPVNNEVATTYIENGLQDTGALNIVTGMILKYRAFDTFGEAHVLYVAACCVMILLLTQEHSHKGSQNECEDLENDRRFEPKNDVILQKVAFFLVPIIFLFGLYIIVNGHLSPGGGFSGGAILGAGLILYVCAYGFQKTHKFFREGIYTFIKVNALCIYALMILYYFVTAGNGLDPKIPLGTPGEILSAGLILPINLMVGLEVACTMYAFYALFRRGGI